jgi:hypothetical protein
LSGQLPSEVITYDRWQQLKPEQKSMFSGCAEGAFRGREEMQGSIHQKFDFILSTAPMWDRCVAICALYFVCNVKSWWIIIKLCPTHLNCQDA